MKRINTYSNDINVITYRAQELKPVKQFFLFEGQIPYLASDQPHPVQGK